MVRWMNFAENVFLILVVGLFSRIIAISSVNQKSVLAWLEKISRGYSNKIGATR